MDSRQTERAQAAMEGDGSAGPASKGSGGAGGEKSKGKKANEKRKAETILCPYPVKVPSANVPEVCGPVILSPHDPDPCRCPHYKRARGLWPCNPILNPEPLTLNPQLQGWRVSVECTDTLEPLSHHITLHTPDGLRLHTMDDVLKYFTLLGDLANFTEPVRKGFLHTLQARMPGP